MKHHNLLSELLEGTDTDTVIENAVNDLIALGGDEVSVTKTDLDFGFKLTITFDSTMGKTSDL